MSLAPTVPPQTTWFIQQASTNIDWAPTLAKCCSKFQGYIGDRTEGTTPYRAHIPLEETDHKQEKSMKRMPKSIQCQGNKIQQRMGRGGIRGVQSWTSLAPLKRQHLRRALKPGREPATGPLGWGEGTLLLSEGNSHAKGERNNQLLSLKVCWAMFLPSRCSAWRCASPRRRGNLLPALIVSVYEGQSYCKSSCPPQRGTVAV